MPSLAAVAPEQGVVVLEQRQPYFVKGVTREQLLGALRRLGPRDEEGVHHAYTSWDILWSPQSLDEKAGQCQLAAVQVLVGLATTLPCWEEAAVADALLVRRWQAFLMTAELLAGLRAPHVRLGFSAAVDIKFLQPVFPGCRLDYHVTQTHLADTIVRFEVAALVEGAQVARGTQHTTRGLPWLRESG